MTPPLLLLLAALADSVTYLALPTGAEANPLVASASPVLAIAAKGLAAVCIAYLSVRGLRYFAKVAAFGSAVWLIGAASNVAVLGGI